MADRGVKLQGWGAEYDRWLLEKLVELKLEPSVSAAIGRIVRQWIERQEKKHRRLGLSEERFRQELELAEQSKAGNVYPFKVPEEDGPGEPKDAVAVAGLRNR